MTGCGGAVRYENLKPDLSRHDSPARHDPEIQSPVRKNPAAAAPRGLLSCTATSFRHCTALCVLQCSTELIRAEQKGGQPCLHSLACNPWPSLRWALSPSPCRPLAERVTPTNFGPVGPNEPILTNVGTKRVIAFYVPDSGRCCDQCGGLRIPGLRNAPYTSSRVQDRLWPGEMDSISMARSRLDRSALRREALATLALSWPAELIRTRRRRNDATPERQAG